jgi:hypothetical protein
MQDEVSYALLTKHVKCVRTSCWQETFEGSAMRRPLLGVVGVRTDSEKTVVCLCIVYRFSNKSDL